MRIITWQQVPSASNDEQASNSNDEQSDEIADRELSPPLVPEATFISAIVAAATQQPPPAQHLDADVSTTADVSNTVTGGKFTEAEVTALDTAIQSYQHVSQIFSLSLIVNNFPAGSQPDP